MQIVEELEQKEMNNTMMLIVTMMMMMSEVLMLIQMHRETAFGRESMQKRTKRTCNLCIDCGTDLGLDLDLIQMDQELLALFLECHMNR